MVRIAYDDCMTVEHTNLVQARLTDLHAQQVDEDIAALGLTTRSEAVREGLNLLHKQAEHDALAREYDEFYGCGCEAPLTEMTVVGDRVGGAG